VNPTFVGTSDKPTTIARTLEDGTTQLYQFEYNSIGNPTKAIDPVGREFTLVYDTNEVDLIEIRQTRAGQNELLLRVTYDPQHNPLTITDAGRQTTTFTYNSRGQVLTATNPRGDTTTYSYDSNGYLLAVDGPLPGTNDTTRFTYDTVGRLRTATDPDGYTLTLDYDAIDRLTRVTYPDSTYESITYNRLDPEVLRDRAGRETRLTYDSLRQLIAVQDPLGQVTRFDWCGCGGLDAMIDPMGRMTRWVRDLQGRVSAKLYADGSQIQYSYDTATGWLKSIRDEQNQITKFDYNLDGTLQEKSFLNAPMTTPAVRLTYDPNYRRLLTMEDGAGVTSYSYNPITGNSLPGAGSLASVDGPLPNDTITFAYDELGRLVDRQINGVGSRWNWDPAGRLTQLTNSLGSFGFTYDGASLRLATMNFPNGQHSVFSYFPNQKDQLLQQITHFKPDSTLLSRFSYDYNPLRQVTQHTQELAGTSALQWTFGYDGADRLTNAVATQAGATAEAHSWKFDALGNRTDETGLTAGNTTSYNALNQVVALTNAPSPPRSYEWDAEGRMVAFTQATHRTEFSYDGYGRRTRIVEKENGSVISDHRYVWCAFDLCEERDASGALVLKRFSTHGVRAENGADIPAGAYFVTRDGLESVREFTDASGAVRSDYAYTPFGQRTRIVGDLDSDFGFASQFLHRPSGLGLAVYRAYDPTLGRWLSRDPLGEGDDLNLYGYAYNDPVNYFDPLGLQNSANKLTQNLQGAKDAQAGLDALKQGQKALDIADKLVEKGVKGTAKDLVEKAREDAIKSLKPAPPRESYKDTTEKMGNTANESSKEYKNKLKVAADQINDNIHPPGTSCSGGTSKTTPSKKDDGWSFGSLIDSVFGSNDPEPAKPMPKPLSETEARVKAAQNSTY